MSAQFFLGFPQPLLGMVSVRLPVVFDDNQLIAMFKPVDILVQAESWYSRHPVLIEAIRYQAASGKPEFSKFNIPPAGLWAISDLDPELSGPVLFARDRDVAAELKNELGSGRMKFTYEFLSGKPGNQDFLFCDLPLSRHRNEKQMLVSHTTGKKAATRFTRIGQGKSFSVWEAEMELPRRHQALIHPIEVGLPVLGDSLYARDKPLLLSRFKKNYQKKGDFDERPLYPGPACYLKQIQMANGIQIDCPQPPKWRALVSQLEKCRD